MRAFQYRFFLRVATSLLCISPGMAFADDAPSRDRFMLVLGGFYSSNTTEANVESTADGANHDIDFEKTFDLDEKELTPIVAFLWRINENWRLDVEYLSLERNSTRSLGKDTQWGDDTYPAGTEVKASFDVADTRLVGGYSFINTADKEFGAGFGLHVLELETKLSAAGNNASGRDVTAPLPVINLFGRLALADNWSIRLRADWLSVEGGAIRDGSVDVNYQPWRHVGFGLGLRALVIDKNIDKPEWKGDARINFQGPTAFVSVSF